MPVSSSVKKVVPPSKRMTHASAPRCSNNETQTHNIFDPTSEPTSDILKGWVTHHLNEAAKAVFEEDQILHLMSEAHTWRGQY